MEEKLQQVLNNLILNHKLNDLKKESEKISNKYKQNTGGSGGILKTESEAITYSAVRMPATFACVKKALLSLVIDQSQTYSLLDVGFGTGAGTLAIMDCIPISSVSALEKETSMLKVGKTIVDQLIEYTTQIEYINQDLIEFNPDKNYDIVLSSFVFNEIEESKLVVILKKLWTVTNKYFIIVDAGTPKVFSNMNYIKSVMKDLNANLVAPCMCEDCENEWCHFIARVRRSAMHRKIKNGTENYEDEKFTYLIYSKTPIDKKGKRIIKRPEISKGKIVHTLCSKDGVRTEIFTKSQGEKYKEVKKKEVGELIY